jgi:hypothetical protein
VVIEKKTPLDRAIEHAKLDGAASEDREIPDIKDDSHREIPHIKDEDSHKGVDDEIREVSIGHNPDNDGPTRVEEPPQYVPTTNEEDLLSQWNG